MYSQILIAVDMSACADAIVRAGFALAQREGARVHLCTALGSPPRSMQRGWLAGRDVDEDLHRAEEQLHAKAKGNGFPSVPYDVAVYPYLPGDEIPRAAKTLGADLIVIGSRGGSGARRFVLGSVAERILANATVPVLVMPVQAFTPRAHRC